MNAWHRILNISSFIVMVSALLTLISVFYFLYTPIKIIQFQKNPIALEKKIYYPGDIITIRVSYCKNIDILGTHTIEIIGRYILPDYTRDTSLRYLPLGCHVVEYDPVLVAVTPPGTYHVAIRVDYPVSFLVFYGRTVQYEIDSVPFEVRNR